MNKINTSFRFFLSAIISLGLFVSIFLFIFNADKRQGMEALVNFIIAIYCFILSLIIPHILSFFGVVSGLADLSNKFTVGKLVVLILNLLLFSLLSLFFLLVIIYLLH